MERVGYQGMVSADVSVAMVRTSTHCSTTCTSWVWSDNGSVPQRFEQP